VEQTRTTETTTNNIQKILFRTQNSGRNYQQKSINLPLKKSRFPHPPFTQAPDAMLQQLVLQAAVSKVLADL